MSRHPLRAGDYLGHMLEAVRRIQHYTRGKSAEFFLSDQLLQDGIARNFEILGEAARNFLDALPGAAQRYPGIPFAAIYGMRNQLSHGYFAIDWDTVWKTIERDIPGLQKELEKAIAHLEQLTA
ncbi:MAG: DUF86 domain-containing protein [Terracidiphilus sp.]